MMPNQNQVNARRYKVNEINQERYFQIPKELFTNPLYKHLNSDAKLLYAILKDRMELSRKNNWVNEKGEIYLIYTREDLMELLDVANATIVKAFKQLKEAALIDEVRPGQGKANLIFINHLELESIKDILDKPIISQNDPIETLAPHKKFKFYTSGYSKFEPLDIQNLNANDTNNNNTDYNQSVCLSVKQDPNTWDDINRQDGQTDVYHFEDIFKNQIGYDDLIAHCHDKAFVDTIIMNMLDMRCNGAIKINGNITPQSVVRSVLAKVTYWHILHVMDRFNRVSSPIINKKEYLQTMIYNSVLEMDTHIKNFVNVAERED